MPRNKNSSIIQRVLENHLDIDVGTLIEQSYEKRVIRKITEMGYKVGPRLRESRLLTPFGRGARVHTT